MVIHNLCNYDVILFQEGREHRFPSKEKGPVASVLAAVIALKDSLISTIHWSEINREVLPSLQEGVFYIVPLEFGQAVGREDLLVPFRGRFAEPEPHMIYGHEFHTKALVKVSEALPPKVA